jgi:hypothetical protein
VSWNAINIVTNTNGTIGDDIVEEKREEKLAKIEGENAKFVRIEFIDDELVWIGMMN